MYNSGMDTDAQPVSARAQPVSARGAYL